VIKSSPTVVGPLGLSGTDLSTAVDWHQQGSSANLLFGTYASLSPTSDQSWATPSTIFGPQVESYLAIANTYGVVRSRFALTTSASVNPSRLSSGGWIEIATVLGPDARFPMTIVYSYLDSVTI
jgi:hypothetical protein